MCVAVPGKVISINKDTAVISYMDLEREIDISGAKTKQLHDCGIIYYPGNPYLLCVMTRGDSFGELSSTIRDISDIIYGVVNDAKRR